MDAKHSQFKTKEEVDIYFAKQREQFEVAQRGDAKVEIVRSFSYKLNIPGAYESRDFFCSQKSGCKWKDAETVSEALYLFCKNEVLKSVNEFRLVDTKKSKDVGRDSAEHDVIQEIPEK